MDFLSNIEMFKNLLAEGNSENEISNAVEEAKNMTYSI